MINGIILFVPLNNSQKLYRLSSDRRSRAAIDTQFEMDIANFQNSLRYSQCHWKQWIYTIVPYIYENAFRYYYAIWEAQQTNQAILTQMPTYETPHKEIRIKVPERKQMGRKPLFTFLDEEE